MVSMDKEGSLGAAMRVCRGCVIEKLRMHGTVVTVKGTSAEKKDASTSEVWFAFGSAAVRSKPRNLKDDRGYRVASLWRGRGVI
jgi:hypothetical protein